MTKEELFAKLKCAKLRKVKSRMVREALEKGSSERGNHRVEYLPMHAGTLEFFYRGTAICVMFLDGLLLTSVNAGEFDRTPSTINQRKTIQQAVEEIRKAASL